MTPISSLSLSLSSLSFSSLFSFLIPVAIFFILIEQVTYLVKKRHSPGPLFVPPFIGNALPLVWDPKNFWEAQAAASARSGFSVDYILGRFMVFIRDTHLSHVVFANVRSDAFHLVGHPFGKKLFGDQNMIFMLDQDHKDLRRRIAPNFTPKALSTYTALQQIIILKHLKKWEQLCSSRHDAQNPISLRLLARDLNLETSQTVFVGPYLGEEERKRFRSDYNLFNCGVLSLPIDLPGFAFRNARLSVLRLVKTLTSCAEKSKKRMERDEEPTCLIDFWMQETVREIAAAKSSCEPSPPPHSRDSEIGAHLFDFLFAAQDASTSSLLWAVALLDAHPDVLARVREEASRIWSPVSDSLISVEQLREMMYTQAVAREVVRFRPPATLVPHVASCDFPLTESFTIPKGSMVFPSVYESSFQGFTEPDRFDPDRFLEGRQEDQVFKKHFLAFGAGSHQCVGQRYALNQLVLFIAMFSMLIDFKRNKTVGCDDFVYNPTIIPKDGCSVFLSRRAVGIRTSV